MVCTSSISPLSLPQNVDFRTRHFRVRCAFVFTRLPLPLLAVMEAFENFLTSQLALQSKETAATSYDNGLRSLQSQFEVQTVWLREI